MSEEGDAVCTQESEEVNDIDEPSDIPGPSQKFKANKLNQYNRIKVMNHLMEKGCEPKSCAAAIRQLKANAEIAEKFVNEKAAAAQEHVHEECDSISFKNINSWLEYYKEKNYHNESYFESGVVMIAIADLKNHPDPKESGGVDFQKIYKFLGDVMLGNPTPPLNVESKEYLGKEFENLINMANTAEGDKDTRELHASIGLKSGQIFAETSVADRRRRKDFGSLDPMGIDKFISSTKRDKKPT